MQAVLPANSAKFFSQLNPIATYDFIGSDMSTELVFEFDFETQELNSKGVISDQMADLGYSTTNCLLCLETIGPLLIPYYCKVVLWGILTILTKYVGCFKD